METDYSKLEAGPTLDRLVAEFVMGWVWLSRLNESKNSNPYRDAWLFPPDSKDVDTGEQGLFGEPIIERSYYPHVRASIVGPFGPYTGGRKNFGPTPDYSTDISAAWLVVEKMREREYEVMVSSNPPDEKGGAWECEMYDELQLARFPAVLVGADTAPLAICLAALKAVESTQPTGAGLGNPDATPTTGRASP